MNKFFLVVAFVGLLIAIVYIGMRVNSSSVGSATKAHGASIISSLPVYPSATLARETTIPDPSVAEFGQRYQAVWTAQAAVPELSAWYQKAFAQAGWSLAMAPADASASVQLISFSQAAGARTINLSLIAHGSVSEITLDYIPGPITEMEGP